MNQLKYIQKTIQMKNNLKIMLVDDNKIDLFIHVEVIKRIPAVKEVMQYTFAGDALNYLQENDSQNWPDLIMLDIYMPIMNGFDFLISYEKLPRISRQNCKVILVSSTLDNEDLKKAKTNSEVFAFLEKPLNPDKLKDIIISIQ